jgi:hypothetical protein
MEANQWFEFFFFEVASPGQCCMGSCVVLLKNKVLLPQFFDVRETLIKNLLVSISILLPLYKIEASGAGVGNCSPD